jgi:phosphatidylserine/phosphatidylglycerophosphate/cardiolipin synthase-like enzyme
MHVCRAVLVALVVTACSAPSHPAEQPPDAGIEIDAAPDASTAGPDFCNATDPRAMPVAVAATPEAGEQPYLDALAQAHIKIRIEIYEMGYGGILDSLVAKLGAGVPVEIIFDQSEKSVNQKYYDQLAAAGAQVKWSSPTFTYQHSKFIIVDAAAAVISTGNFSKTYSILLERNFVATDTDPADLADLIAMFEADWAGVAPSMSCTRLVVSPINARPRILDVIDGATTTLTIESMQFADGAVRTAVMKRAAAGVQVRVMLADAGWITANAAASQYLLGLGIPVRSIPHLHTKVVVADGVRAYLGSENLSTTSLDHNREVGLIVTDAVSIDPLTTTFEKDWAAGTSF